jgi:hypothetical protein
MFRVIFKWVFRIVLIGFIGIQFFQIDRSTPPVNPQKDFVNMMNPPTEVGNLFKKACYDCHSYETKYPWYSYVAPVSWWIGHHIEEGRRHLNFSVWGNYSQGKASHKLEECIEEIAEGEMPLSSYSIIHSGSELSPQQVKEIIKWLRLVAKAD